jgi:DNA-binding NarL/FixJ family response regulator
MFKTLLIEDNSAFRSIFRERLCFQFPFMKVSEASDGSSALRNIEADPPDLIFMDIDLPDEDGLVLTKKIKEERPDVTILILTSYDSPEYRRTAAEYRADDFLVKDSISTTEIVASVLSILERKGFDENGS